MRLPSIHRAVLVVLLSLGLGGEIFAQLIAVPPPVEPPSRPGELVGEPTDPDPDPPHPGPRFDDFLDGKAEPPCPAANGAPVFDFVANRGNDMQSPAGVAIGDPDGDGKLDLAWTAVGENTLSLYLGAGAGFYAFEVGYGGTDGAFADFDADGQGDLIVTNMDDDTVTIKWQLLGGTETFAVGDGPTRVEVGDLNGDGYDDFATLNILSDDVTVCLRNSNQVAFAGGFDSFTIPIGESVDLKLADMDGNGTLDLVYPSGYQNATVKYRKNDGNGNFGAVVSIPMGSDQNDAIHGIGLEDLNGDGLLDVVATRSSHEIVRVLATGIDTFGAPAAAPTGNNPFQIVMDDFDVDGNIDFAITHLHNSFVSVYLGDGAGNVAGPWTYDLPGPTYGIVSGDLNDDGIPDLAVTAGQRLYVLLTECPGDDNDGGGGKVANPGSGGRDPEPGVGILDPGSVDDPSRPSTRFRRGDVNQSADLDLADAIQVLGWLFLSGDAPSCEKSADSNDDGALDSADVSYLLNFLFLGGPALNAPSICGSDPTADSLSCESYSVCKQ